jgi:DNA-binding MarR family transcriptional regulator
MVHRLSRSLLRGSMAFYLHEYGLGVPEVQILNLLSRGRPLASKEIAEILAINKALVSRAVRQLTALGYITTKVDPQDGRFRICDLTPKGRDFVETSRPDRHKRQDKFLSVLSRQEQILLVDVLDRLFVSSEAWRYEEAVLLNSDDIGQPSSIRRQESSRQESSKRSNARPQTARRPVASTSTSQRKRT